MGFFQFCAWLYRRVGCEGPVQAGLMADRVTGLVLDPHPDGEVGGAALRTETRAHEAALALAELAVGGPELVCGFLDGLYREAVGVPCPHFLAGGSLRQAERGGPPRGG